jgi:hypothetical protein
MLAASAEHWLVADHTKVNHCEPWLGPDSATFTIFFLIVPGLSWGMTLPSLYILLTLNNVENLMSNNTLISP